MSTSKTIARYLADKAVAFAAHKHPKSATSAEAAHLAHVPERALAKAVVLKDDDGLFLAVLPASRSILLGELWRETHRPAELAKEAEITGIFNDCDPGAVPPFAEAYGLESIVDGHLLEESTVYCEGGDHETLLEISGKDFKALMAGVPRGAFAEPREVTAG